MQPHFSSRRHLLSSLLAGLLGCFSLGMGSAGSPPPLIPAPDPATPPPARSSSAFATGGTVTYSAQGLPSGLSLDSSSGAISGTIDRETGRITLE